MEYFYVRVSTKEQEIERQLIKAKELGISEEHIFIDKQSGKDFNREAYQELKKTLRAGDIVYLDALDRLGRNYDLIIQEWREITREINADIVVLDNASLFDSRQFKTMGDMGKLMEDQFLSLLAFVADQERKKLLQRQKEGIAIAKAAGKYKGKPKKYTERNPKLVQAVEWYIEGKKTVKEITLITGISRSSLYEYIKENNIQRISM